MTAYNPSSIFIWLPAVKAAGVPTPRTEMVYLGWKPMMGLLDGDPLPSRDIDRLVAAATRIGYPLFLRTDLVSGKHDWAETCFVERERVLLQHVVSVIDYNGMLDMMGPPFVGLALREYIPLDSTFAAFNGMPVARERRYFAEEGKALCRHGYWIEDAIGTYGAPHRPMLPPDWRQRLAALNEEGEEVEQLTAWASAVSEHLEGAWSVDFAQAADGRWLLIDMALAAESWHPECGAKA